LNSILNTVKVYIGDLVEDNEVYKYLKHLANSNIFWDKISEIEEVALMDLYDFTVPVSHTFISNGFISHNTLASKVLANELIKGRDNIVTIDCSEYSADHEYSKLIGAPSGYVGYEAGGVLTNAIHKNPFCVVVFDEVEKASHKVHELLLQILEEGRLTDGKGKPANFNEAIIIMTSNVGVKEVDDIKKTIGFGNVAEITDEKKDKALTEALKKKFKPEFLNRIDAIINFKNLKKNDYMRIIDIELYKLNDNLKSNATEYKNVELEFSKSVKSMVYDRGINEEYGARPLKRCIEKEIATPLAKFLLGEEFKEDSIVHVDFKRNKLKFEVEKKVVDPPLYMNKEYQDMVNDSLEGV
jgi:ATP-dependent Clp protease ATP-binding subunit ClpA